MNRLLRPSANPTDSNCVLTSREFFRSQLKHWPEEAMGGIADCELRRVYANRETACSGGEIVSNECTLTPFIKLALRIQCQGTGGDHESLLQTLAKV
jgi:hypothetical protein